MIDIQDAKSISDLSLDFCWPNYQEKCKYFQALPLCESGHAMELIEGSENEDWICDFCESFSKNHVGEQLQAWRCPQDIRDANLRYSKARGCDYDICNNCIKEYRVSENSEIGNSLIQGDQKRL